MWESRRDFQRVWEGWEAGILDFHAFHTLSFPWPAFRPGDAGFKATSTVQWAVLARKCSSSLLSMSGLAIWR